MTGIGLAAGATATAAALVPASDSASATAAASVPGLDCVTATVAVAVHPDGTQGPAVNGDGYGRLWTFPDGSQQLDAPVGWNPLNASDQELATFRSMPRPVDPKGLAEWKGWASRYHDPAWYAPPVVCTDRDLVMNVTNYAESPNWAGGMAVDGTTFSSTYSRTDSHFYQPALGGGCPNQMGWSAWTGLGGWNSGNGGIQRLLQTGVAANTANGWVYPFYEAIATDSQNPAVFNTSIGTVAVGDHVRSSLQYTSSPSVAYFAYQDYNTGASWNMSITTAGGYPISHFYDGSTAEWITEQPGKSGGGLYDLFPTTNPDNQWDYAVYNNNIPIANAPTWNIHQRNRSDNHLMQGSYFNGTTAWRNTAQTRDTSNGSEPYYSCS